MSEPGVTTAQPQPQQLANPVRTLRPGFGTQEFGAKASATAAGDLDAWRRPSAWGNQVNLWTVLWGSTNL